VRACVRVCVRAKVWLSVYLVVYVRCVGRFLISSLSWAIIVVISVPTILKLQRSYEV